MKEKNIVEHSQCGVTNLSSSLTDLFVFLAEMADSLMMLRLIPSNISKIQMVKQNVSSANSWMRLEC